MVFRESISNRNEEKVKMNKPVYLGLSILEIMYECMNFGMVILNQSINTVQRYATWIQIVLLFILRLKMFIKAFQMMLENDLIHQIMKSIDHCLQQKIKK